MSLYRPLDSADRLYVIASLTAVYIRFLDFMNHNAKVQMKVDYLYLEIQIIHFCLVPSRFALNFSSVISRELNIS